jgi:hypothetical protein
MYAVKKKSEVKDTEITKQFLIVWAFSVIGIEYTGIEHSNADYTPEMDELLKADGWEVFMFPIGFEKWKNAIETNE